MPTIKRKRPQDSPPGDYTAACDYCGVVWLRSRLKKDRAGLLRCPDEGDGLDQVTLSEGNAAATRPGTRTPPRRDGLPFTVDINGPSQHLCNWDQTPPEVVSLTPADGSTGNPPSSQLVLQFDEVVARGTGNFELYSGVALVASVDVQDLENVRFALETVTITLPAATAPTTGYHVLVESGVVLNCNLSPWVGFQSATDWNWTTGAAVNPTLLSSTPSDGATGVLPSADLQLVFSEAVQPNVGAILLKRFSDDAMVDSWNIATAAVFTGDTVDLPLGVVLADETQYYLEIASGVIEDLSGNPYAGLVKGELEFTTGDSDAPYLSSSVPADGATGIDPTADIQLVFNEDVQAATGTIFLKRFSDDVTVDSWDVATDVSFAGAVVTLSPTGVPGQVQYYLEIASGVIEDLSGNAYVGLTKGALDFTTTDVDSPTLVSSTPMDNAVGVSVSTDIQLVFNEDVQAATGTIFLKRFSDDVTVDSWDVATDVVFTGSTVDITLSTPLAGETQYYLEIASGVIEDLSGNPYAGLVKGELEFTTTDVTAPLLLSSTPSDGATEVSPSTAIQLVFDEDVQAGSGIVFLKLFSDDTTVDFWDIEEDVVFTGDTVDMTLAFPLDGGTQYYLEIASGVIEDLSGNAYVGLTKGALDFTTEESVIAALGTNVELQATAPSGTNNRTISHTLVAGEDRIMRVVVALRSSSGAPTLNSVTYGGVTATLAVTRTTALGVLSVYYVLESSLPANGARDIIANVTFPNDGRVSIFGSLIENAAQSAPELTDGATKGFSSTSSLTCNVTGISNGAWSLGGWYLIGSSPPDPTWNNGQVEYYDTDVGADAFRNSAGELQGANGETSLSVSFASTSLQGAMVTASFAKA